MDAHFFSFKLLKVLVMREQYLLIIENYFKMKAIRVHGQVKRGIHNVLGLNANIPKCAILIFNWEYLKKNLN